MLRVSCVPGPGSNDQTCQGHECVIKRGIITISLLRDRGSHHEKHKHLVWLLDCFQIEGYGSLPILSQILTQLLLTSGGAPVPTGLRTGQLGCVDLDLQQKLWDGTLTHSAWLKPWSWILFPRAKLGDGYDSKFLFFMSSVSLSSTLFNWSPASLGSPAGGKAIRDDFYSLAIRTDLVPAFHHMHVRLDSR